MKKFSLVFGLAVVAGCADEGASGEARRGTVDVTIGEDRIEGTYVADDGEVRFEAETIAPDVYVTRVEVNGMTLVATHDRTDRDGIVISRDGYATIDGSDTLMTNEDRLLVAAFVRDLEAEIPDIAALAGAPASFDEVVNKWAQWPPVMSLASHEVYETQRSGNQCYYAQCTNGSYTGSCANRFVIGYHDGSCSNVGDDSSTISYNQMGDHCGTNGDEDARFSTSSSVCSAGWMDNNHNTDREYAVGNCMGRYGSGCGAGTSYNWESLDHDSCVRNGHWVTSSWCSDELYYTHSDGNCY